MTTLDDIQFNLDNAVLVTVDSRVRIASVRDFVCAHGGIYVKYPDQRCD